MTIFLAADHAGFELKEFIKKELESKGHKIVDKGAYMLEPEDDYPLYMKAAALEVQKNPESRGIIFGGSGQGEAIAANRFRGVRATVYYGGNKEIIVLSREHNDANILSLGARFLSISEAQEAVFLWLETKFSGDERHKRRIGELDES
ncbi:MAG: ribose-5-phosphate isomerase [Candidatus Ryanbacteria bacterium RIFCSPHIGHO2_12_FULL_47_12b]|uniref:Ribose-5-phosphate isomerase n=2 Tax=Candidatus Ryaniibacteriota TaxID=1817914 RepID=A0A1G2H565_9BACT|nr:MAG: Ribose-5-phosphate isomerase B [Parcubacteria group bacterium GW2011_GWA2_47_10b]KKU85420.1 MAG: Ribose-5-phosphate isomerase B [Parcubacteria group bacterium GW2011_GWA1_47_9]OGZ46517.1 MAG: ribose-5-phosphate isomerase [Candidatus Ryanbacteria bacterium RIFCSPHIGHO2_01_FULL_48_80]OGZ52522.1 MAG: ribose-5-phosphate isomerase [Candidatus Ryanbacteria bacterium RIFCSPHIGHO2_12_FULL_47_12b]OGZ52937.1 MAG: ribose-5-phosphate isomerase [Candidatus Ryanbacteria bacterium RIFCSPLOWO2_01_FULL_